jgi:hypothetical protein
MARRSAPKSRTIRVPDGPLPEVRFQQFGPLGLVEDVPVERPDPSQRDAPTLAELQRRGRATKPSGDLLDAAIKRGSDSHAISDALAELRRE